jgi:cell shape-determining protein MreC
MPRDGYSPKLMLGVGNGTGNLFVEGDYDSITILQNKLLELEELRRRVKDLEEENQKLRKK